MKNNYCPICGLDNTNFHGLVSSDGDICHSCGFQFNYFGVAFIGTDKEESFYAGYRTFWIRNGKKWYFGDDDESRPKNWQPEEQLRNINL